MGGLLNKIMDTRSRTEEIAQFEPVWARVWNLILGEFVTFMLFMFFGIESNAKKVGLLIALEVIISLVCYGKSYTARYWLKPGVNGNKAKQCLKWLITSVIYNIIRVLLTFLYFFNITPWTLSTYILIVGIGLQFLYEVYACIIISLFIRELKTVENKSLNNNNNESETETEV